MHNHLRQNMCAEHPNRNLANGPNHPGPGPEEIPMPDVSIREDDGVKEAGGTASRTDAALLNHLPASLPCSRQYISKNIPATERVIRPATEGSFPASHASSRSHNSSTRAHSSTHRCGRRAGLDTTAGPTRAGTAQPSFWPLMSSCFFFLKIKRVTCLRFETCFDCGPLGRAWLRTR